VLTSAWDTSGGHALRVLLWSLRGSHVGADGVSPVAVRLWEVLSALDDGLRTEFGCLLAQSMDAQAALSQELLILSGEWDRIDSVPLAGAVLEAIQEALTEAASS